MWHHFHSLSRYNNNIYGFGRPFFAPSFFLPIHHISTRPNDGWTGLYIKLWRPPALSDHFPRHGSFQIKTYLQWNNYLPNTTSDHRNCSCDCCFHLLAVTGTCFVVSFELTKYLYHWFDRQLNIYGHCATSACSQISHSSFCQAEVLVETEQWRKANWFLGDNYICVCLMMILGEQCLKNPCRMHSPKYKMY